MTLRCTASGVPGMRAPAAAGWPPPPNWPQISLTFTCGAFRAQADARQFRFHFLEHAGDHHRLNRADVVNQAFRVVALRAGAGEIFFLQPEPRDAVVVRQPEFAVNVLQQPGARQRIRLINLVANFREVRAARDQFRAGVKGAGPRGRVLKRAGVRGNGGEQQVGNRLGDRPARDFEQPVNQFAAWKARAAKPSSRRRSACCFRDGQC